MDIGSDIGADSSRCTQIAFVFSLLQSIFGEDALANVSLEKNLTKPDAPVTGHIRSAGIQADRWLRIQIMYGTGGSGSSKFKQKADPHGTHSQCRAQRKLNILLTINDPLLFFRFNGLNL